MLLTTWSLNLSKFRRFRINCAGIKTSECGVEKRLCFKHAESNTFQDQHFRLAKLAVDVETGEDL